MIFKLGRCFRIAEVAPHWKSNGANQGDIISFKRYESGRYIFLHLDSNTELPGIRIDIDGIGSSSGIQRIEEI